MVDGMGENGFLTLKQAHLLTMLNLHQITQKNYHQMEEEQILVLMEIQKKLQSLNKL